MKKAIKFILILLVVDLVGYKSIYFKKLSEVRASTTTQFDAVAFANKLWERELPPKLDSAIELNNLIKLVEANPTDAFSKYSNAMGIGNYRYSLVKVIGTVGVINEDDIAMQVNHEDSLMIVKLATEYIYGNAIRDASGLVDIKDFANATDLNNISEELNKKVRTLLLPEFKKQVRKADTLEVFGAIELNKEHINFNFLELIPLRINILRK